MRILIANPKRTYCLRIPLMLLCNRAGAALLASGMRRARALQGGPEEEGATLVTRNQAYAMLKALRQSKGTLQASGLPLADIEKSEGSRIVITL